MSEKDPNLIHRIALIDLQTELNKAHKKNWLIFGLGATAGVASGILDGNMATDVFFVSLLAGIYTTTVLNRKKLRNNCSETLYSFTSDLLNQQTGRNFKIDDDFKEKTDDIISDHAEHTDQLTELEDLEEDINNIFVSNALTLSGFMSANMASTVIVNSAETSFIGESFLFTSLVLGMIAIDNLYRMKVQDEQVVELKELELKLIKDDLRPDRYF